jgi:alpha-glucuronidase
MKSVFLFLFCMFRLCLVQAEDVYRLWLRYDKVKNQSLLQAYRQSITGLCLSSTSPTISAAREELMRGLEGLLGRAPALTATAAAHTIVAGTPASTAFIASLPLQEPLRKAGSEGYIIYTVAVRKSTCIVIAANTDIGVLYGSFALLRLLQTEQDIRTLSVVRAPRIGHRVLDHWDNLNRYVERGYAGISIWNWHTLPGYIDQRYIDYARANASIGINGSVLNNVNANATILTKDYLVKVAALANTFRPYGIRVYLSARFSAPIETGGLKTADPLDTAVRQWWREKVNEIYSLIPDFGGFLVKANSEGQPGPQNYGRTHADGANMLAAALAPHGGIVMWRAFVYSSETPDDRFKQAYNEFKPLDGQFAPNVLVQVKNGPIDFQPREPFHPLFGAMPRTALMPEFQLTQEYLGFSTHLAYLAPLFKECLDADTYAKGRGSLVQKVADGSLEGHTLTGIAGVANIGNERNWTGHPFAQANWYAFGRLAWEPSLSADIIAREWIGQTFSNDPEYIKEVAGMMKISRAALVSYMTPLGLHHIMGYGHHYGPAPWYDKAPRADWNPVYYHRADAYGIGFDRTAAGSNALAQYAPEVRQVYQDSTTCPDDYLLWFHHASWHHKMPSGKTLWNELCQRYETGVLEVNRMQRLWNGRLRETDPERFAQVKQLLAIQADEAGWWRDACLLYFQTFSRMPLPEGYPPAKHTLEYYMNLKFTFAPGN